MAKQVYTSENVLEATRKRISNIFDNFKNISVSISGGKDSTVCTFLAIQEAKKKAKLLRRNIMQNTSLTILKKWALTRLALSVLKLPRERRL